MTAKQLAARREKLYPTRAAAARAMGISPGRLAHYEKGRRPVPAWLVKLLDCIEAQLKSSALDRPRVQQEQPAVSPFDYGRQSLR